MTLSYPIMTFYQPGKKASLPKQVIPAEYSKASAPKLNFVVPDGGTDSADFKL